MNFPEFDSVLTVSDRNMFLNVLRGFKDGHTVSVLGLPLSRLRTLESFRDERVSRDPKALDEAIEYLNNMPVCKLTIAFEPKDMFIEEALHRVRGSFSEKCILDITVDKKIGAGFLMSYGGKYYDRSLKKLINDYYEQPTTKAS